MLTTATVFWVLMYFDTGTKQLHSQPFVSQVACEQALEFVERARGTYAHMKCIKDETRRLAK